MKAVILMAGIGSRLGRTLPKCLTEIPGGETILGNQIRLLRPHADQIIGVVGFKKEIIIELYPELTYVYNPEFSRTNTSKSLLAALKAVGPDDLLWINGDVVCTQDAVRKVAEAGNAVGVTYCRCEAEEVKFTTNPEGYLMAISKEVGPDAQGEAVGINRVSKESFGALRAALERCDDKDYFEKAIEFCLAQGVNFKAVDVGSDASIEVDFTSDLQRVWEVFAPWDDGSARLQLLRKVGGMAS
ncbi:MAG: NTP transferase domain-containing protein [Bacteroidota bacterium]